MLMHAIVHGGCTDTVRESALKVDSGKENPLPNRGLEPEPVLRRAFQSDAVLTELFPAPVSLGLNAALSMWARPSIWNKDGS